MISTAALPGKEQSKIANGDAMSLMLEIFPRAITRTRNNTKASTQSRLNRLPLALLLSQRAGEEALVVQRVTAADSSRQVIVIKEY
jgi:hypothetical protein